MSPEPLTRTQHKAAWIERWRRHVAGTIALGHANVRVYLLGDAKKRHPLDDVMDKLDSEAIGLLSQLYDDLTKPRSKP